MSRSTSKAALPLKEMFYFDSSVFPPTPSILTSNDFEKLGCVLVPPAEGFDEEWLEEDTLSTTIVKMVPKF